MPFHLKKHKGVRLARVSKETYYNLLHVQCTILQAMDLIQKFHTEGASGRVAATHSCYGLWAFARLALYCWFQTLR